MSSRVIAVAFCISGLGLFLSAPGPAEARGTHSSTRFHGTGTKPVIGSSRHRHGFGHHIRRHGKFPVRGAAFLDGGFWPTGVGASTVVNVNGSEGSFFAVVSAVGIREAPYARPVIYVVDDQPRRVMTRPERRSSAARVLSRDEEGQWTERGGDSSESPGPLIIRVPVR